jgi:hypothetical protein
MDEDAEDGMPLPPPSLTEIRGQLERMVESQVFAARPRCAAMLRYFVEVSIRNGFDAIDQHSIAVDCLGFPADFRSARSAEVRVKIGRLRQAIGRYYAGTGKGDSVIFGVSPGPYRLTATRNPKAPGDVRRIVANRARKERPTLMVIEPEVVGSLPGHENLGQEVTLQLCSLAAEHSVVSVGGPLLRERLASSGESAARIAASLGYDAVGEPTIDLGDGRCLVRLSIDDVRLGEPMDTFARAIDPAVASPWPWPSPPGSTTASSRPSRREVDR